MKLIKILTWLVGLVVLVVIAAFVYLSLNLNSVVKRAVEEVGPELTQTGVSLETVDISLREGRASLLGFSIDNPKGFTANKVLEFGEFTLQIEPASLSSDVIVVKNITITGIALTVEQLGTTTNLQAIKKAVDAYLPSSSSNPTEASTGSDLRFMVEKAVFNEGSIALITEKYGEKSLSLPAFSQQNLGNRSEGLSADELAKRLLDALTDKAKSAAEKEMGKMVTDEVKEKAKDKLKDKLKGLLNN